MRRQGLSPVLLAGALLALTSCDHFAAARASAPAQPQLTPVPDADARAAPCDVRVEPGATVAVETVIGTDGRCVPPQDLVVYRCDPTQEQVAVADIGGTAHRFLGGSYAVAVDAVPPDAHTVGVTGAGRLSTTAGDRAL